MSKVEEEEFESFADEEPIHPVSINKYDPYNLRGFIDDCIVELLNENQFIEDNYWINLKILITASACALTAFMQLYKPNDRWKFENNQPF